MNLQKIMNPMVPQKLMNPNYEVTNKLKRRSKKDKIGRNFVCGCQKRYLSYPALYTHIKTKHNGIQPEGTKDLNTNQKTKRGRPKKVDFFNSEINQTHNIIQSVREQNIFKSNQETDNVEQSEQLQNKEYWLNEVIRKDDLQRTSLYLKDRINIWGGVNPFKQFYELNYDTDVIVNKIIQNFKVFQQEQQNINDNYSEKNWKNEQVQQPLFLLSLFLYNLSKIVDQKVFKLFTILIKYLLQCLNQYGYEIIVKKLDEEQRKFNCGYSENFIEMESSEHIPLVIDFYLKCYLPKKQVNFNQYLAITMCMDLVKWLCKIKATKWIVGVSKSRMDQVFNFNQLINKQYSEM